MVLWSFEFRFWFFFLVLGLVFTLYGSGFGFGSFRVCSIEGHLDTSRHSQCDSTWVCFLRVATVEDMIVRLVRDALVLFSDTFLLCVACCQFDSFFFVLFVLSTTMCSPGSIRQWFSWGGRHRLGPSSNVLHQCRCLAYKHNLHRDIFAVFECPCVHPQGLFLQGGGQLQKEVILIATSLLPCVTLDQGTSQCSNVHTHASSRPAFHVIVI